jgi:hypothetical protein
MSPVLKVDLSNRHVGVHWLMARLIDLLSNQHGPRSRCVFHHCIIVNWNAVSGSHARIMQPEVPS